MRAKLHLGGAAPLLAGCTVGPGFVPQVNGVRLQVAMRTEWVKRAATCIRRRP